MSAPTLRRSLRLLLEVQSKGTRDVRWPAARRWGRDRASARRRARLSWTAHRLLPQAVPLSFQTARARYAGLRLIVVARDCRSARNRTRQTRLNPRSPANFSPAPLDAGSIP